MSKAIATTIFAAAAGEAPENAFPDHNQSWWDMLIGIGFVFAAAAFVAWLVAFLLNRVFPRSSFLMRFLTASFAPILVILTVIGSINIGVDGTNFADQVEFFADMPREGRLLLTGVIAVGIIVAYITVGRRHRREMVRRKEELKVFK